MDVVATALQRPRPTKRHTSPYKPGPTPTIPLHPSAYKYIPGLSTEYTPTSTASETIVLVGKKQSGGSTDLGPYGLWPSATTMMESSASAFSPGALMSRLEPRQEVLANNGPALRVITGLERGGSVLSLLGSLFVIVTFLTSHAFHKPVNRLVFYASFGNLMTNVGTLISTAFTQSPLSPGCQFQGFLIQM